MRIEKSLIEKIANGETFMKGETVANAKTILKPGIWNVFSKFAFFYEGDDDNLLDAQDCILDFPLFNAELTVMDIPKEIHPFGKWQVFGMLPEHSLEKLFYDLIDDNEWLRTPFEGKTFRIRGVEGKFKVSFEALQQWLDSEFISFKQCLEMMRV